MSDFIVTLNKKKRIIKIINEETVSIDNKIVSVDLSKVNDYLYLIKVGNKVYEITTTKLSNEKYSFLLDGHNFETTVRTNLKEKAVEYLRNKEKLTHRDEVTAPMPGLIVSLKKKKGDEVKIGESILILEAMKMENDLRSPATGIIKQVNFKEGDNVEKGAVILIIG